MPLAEHLRELRNRLLKSVAAISVATVVALFFYRDIVDFLMRPVLESVGCSPQAKDTLSAAGETCADFTVNGMLSPFTIMLKVSFMTGMVVATPIWLYQLWAFLAPGLHKHERRYSLSFVGAGVPLFVGGAYFAYRILPTTAKVLLDFTPASTRNFLPLDDFLDLLTRMVTVFGLAFEMPLLLVLLNFAGAVSGRRMLGWWRLMVMGITLFGAIATPSTDPVGMLALAVPVTLLYFAATGVALLNDRRKARREAVGPADDEASELDLTPEGIGEIEPVAPGGALPEATDGQVSGDRPRQNGYDDAT